MRYFQIAGFALTTLVIFAFTQSLAQAQTFTVIHTFTGSADGATPFGSLTVDRAGNLYGTASAGGYTGNNCTSAGCGTVFQLTHRGTGWIFTPLYSFQGNSDGAAPYAGVSTGPNGSLYGTTLLGGTTRFSGYGVGTVFNLRPPAHASGNVFAGWTDTVLYRFGGVGGGSDGEYPAFGSVIFDPAGNMYGTTSEGGFECSDGGFCGTVFKLTPAGGGWTESTFAFRGNEGGGNPLSGVILDASGNLFGTTSIGNYDPVAYELTPSGSGWVETSLHNFGFGPDPRGGVIFDGSGGLFGTTVDGTVYQLSPSGAQWIYSLLYMFSGNSGSWNGVIRDASGNLYGTTCGDGTNGEGLVFKLTRSQSGWTETDLYDFTGGSDGSCPIGGLALDAAGNLFGTTSYGGGGGCGAGGCGVVWEITL